MFVWNSFARTKPFTSAFLLYSKLRWICLIRDSLDLEHQDSGVFYDGNWNEFGNKHGKYGTIFCFVSFISNVSESSARTWTVDLHTKNGCMLKCNSLFVIQKVFTCSNVKTFAPNITSSNKKFLCFLSEWSVRRMISTDFNASHLWFFLT